MPHRKTNYTTLGLIVKNEVTCACKAKLSIEPGFFWPVKCCFEVQCEIEVEFKIYINPKKQTWNVENIYGHEQKHIISAIDEINKTVLPFLNEWEDRFGCSSPDQCAKDAEWLSSVGKSKISTVVELEGKHGNPGSPPKTDGVPPIGGFPDPGNTPETPVKP